MPNRANQWKQGRKKELIAKVAPRKHGCQYQNCHVTAPSRLEFEHIKSTPVSRSGPREVKTKFADINRYPNRYRVSCEQHKNKIPGTARHDRLMRRLGHR